MTQQKINQSQIATSAVTAYIATLETRTSGTYGALATAGPAVTINIGSNGLALVSIVAGNIYDNTANATAFMSFAVSGANTQAAADNYSVHMFATGANVPQIGTGATFLLTGLTAGSTTFTTQYRSSGTDTSGYQDRRISVVAL